MNIDTSVLRGLLLIHKRGTFLAAATELNRTQSALSQQMALFEEQLGKPLFIRKGRNKVLNDEGLRVYKIAEAIIDLADEIKNPSTDSMQRQWMAEGARNVVVALKACEDEFPQESIDIVHECELIAEGVAAQLRAGEQGGDHA